MNKGTLKQLILDNPELPVVVKFLYYCDDYRGYDADLDYATRVYENPDAYIGESLNLDDHNLRLKLLEHSAEFYDGICISRESFEIAMYKLYEGEKTRAEIQKEIAEYEPLWRKSIIVEL